MIFNDDTIQFLTDLQSTCNDVFGDTANVYGAFTNDITDLNCGIQFKYNKWYDITVQYISGCSIWYVSLKIDEIKLNIKRVPLTNSCGMKELFIRIKSLCDDIEF